MISLFSLCSRSADGNFDNGMKKIEVGRRCPHRAISNGNRDLKFKAARWGKNRKAGCLSKSVQSSAKWCKVVQRAGGWLESYVSTLALGFGSWSYSPA